MKYAGYNNLFFHSNAGITYGNSPVSSAVNYYGAVEDFHVYSGHGAPEQGIFFDHIYTEGSGWNDNPKRKTNLTPVVTECGTFYPNQWRALSDIAMYDHFIRSMDKGGLGAKIIAPFQLSSGREVWGNSKPWLDPMAYSNDLPRSEAVEWLLHKLYNLGPYFFNTGRKGFKAEPFELYPTAPTYKVTA
jgi:hypothetical protein